MQAIKKRLIFDKIVTEPEEMQLFINFIDKNKPYDIIVDGLNIMYRTKHGFRKDIMDEVRNFKTITVA